MKLKKQISIILSLLMAATFTLAVSAVDKPTVVTVAVGEEIKTYTVFADGWNAAVKAAKTSENVMFTLNCDWIADSSGSFGSGDGFQNGAVCCNTAKAITIDLNGFTMDRGLIATQEDGAVIYVASELNVIDSSEDNSGIITGGCNEDDGGGIVLIGNATFWLKGGTVANCVSDGAGGGIYLDDEKASLCIVGGCLYGNHSLDGSGGAFYCDDGAVIVRNAVIEGNYASDEGGAICMEDGTISVTNTSFYSNKTEEEGGAVYLEDGIESEFKDCIFAHNEAADGGAIYINSDNGTRLDSCNMYSNNAENNGGALYVNGDKVFTIGGDYQQNKAGKNGGGIYVDSMYDVNIAGKLIINNNTANAKANNICLQDGNFSTAYLYCGGLYEGSSIWLSSTDSDDRLAIENIDAYQYKNYIHFDSGYAEDRLEIHNESQEGIKAEGSALGDGNYVTVAVLSGIVLIIGTLLVIYAIKKKKGAVTDAEKDS